VKFVVQIMAFSFGPLRRFLEEKMDELLFGQRGEMMRELGIRPD